VGVAREDGDAPELPAPRQPVQARASSAAVTAQMRMSSYGRALAVRPGGAG
jgi:hypothetical protein